MSFSVESRAISSFDKRHDIFVTVVHLPYRLKEEIPDFLARCVDIPKNFATSYQQYVDLADRGPKPHGHNGRYRPNHERVPLWLATPNAFLHQSLKVQLAMRRPSILVDIDRQQITVQNLARRNIAADSLDYWLDEVNGSQFLAENKISRLNGELLAAYSMMLDELNLDGEDIASSEQFFQDSLRHYEIAYSHSPEIGSITLQEILQGGIRSACLLPLSTGIWAGHTNLLSGDILTGFEMVGGGAGMTICALSTLWVADRIMRGIKNFGSSADTQQGAQADVPASDGPAA